MNGVKKERKRREWKKRENNVRVNQKGRGPISSCRNDLYVSCSLFRIKCYRNHCQQRNVHQFRFPSPRPSFSSSLLFSRMEISPRKSSTKTSKRITSRTNEEWTSVEPQKVKEEPAAPFRRSLTRENCDVHPGSLLLRVYFKF